MTEGVELRVMTEEQKTKDPVAALARVVEALLFTAGEPMTLTRLAKISGAKKSEVKKALALSEERYAQKNGGLFLITKDDSVQLTTHPDVSDAIMALQEDEANTALSRPAREVLSIIAYRGPIGRTSIEAIRGVNCSHTIRTLLLRGLITRSDNPQDNREYVYNISFDFLKSCGLSKVDELPDFEKLSEDKRLTNVLGDTPPDA